VRGKNAEAESKGRKAEVGGDEGHLSRDAKVE
jgi:hypothetical protein